jgi:CxxC motif-containing protein
MFVVVAAFSLAYMASIVSIRAILFIVNAIFANRSVMIVLVRIHGGLLQYASIAVQNEIIAKNPEKLQYASIELQKDISMKKPVKLKYASHNVQKIIVSEDVDKLQHASCDVQKIIIANNPTKIQYASDSLKNNREIVMAAVEKDNGTLQHASMTLQKEIIEADPSKLQYASEYIQDDRGVVLHAVKQDGMVLQFASKAFQDDRGVVLYAVKQSGCALSFANKTLKNDKKLVMIAVKQDCRALKYASQDLQDDKRVVLAAVAQDGIMMHLASETLKNDRDIVLVAASTYSAALYSGNKYFENDEEVVLSAATGNIRVLLKYASRKMKANAEVQGFQEDVQEFYRASAKYINLTSNNGIIPIELTETEASQDRLVALLSLPYQSSYENKLNIIYAVLDKIYIVTNLASLMLARLSHTRIEMKTSVVGFVKNIFTRAPASEYKFIFHVDQCLLPKLSSKEGLQNFVQEQLQVILCKDRMPSDRGCLSEFRLCLRSSLKSNHELKYDMAKLLSIKYYNAGFFLLPVIEDEVETLMIEDAVEKLTDEELMNLLVKLKPDNLYSLHDAMLSSNSENRGVRLQATQN